MYKIKQKPEDFFVREISSVDFREKGRYTYFYMKKRNYTTLRAVQHIADALKVQSRKFGFAGTKDKNAVTGQFVSVENVSRERIEKIKLKDIEIEYAGKGDKPISLGDLKGNWFRIVVRDAGKEPRKAGRFKNLFGEQRFSKNNAEVGKAIIKKDFKKAVSLIKENKGDYEDAVKNHLQENPNDFVGALKKIPMKILKLYVHAYQSLLWNRMAEKTDKEKLPLIGFGTAPDKEASEVMQKEGIAPRDFIIKEIPELSSEGGMRGVFAEAEDFNFWKRDSKTIVLVFSLPKGSYATEFIRQVFQ